MNWETDPESVGGILVIILIINSIIIHTVLSWQVTLTKKNTLYNYYYWDNTGTASKIIYGFSCSTSSSE